MSDGWAEPWIFPLPWPPLADSATQIGLRPWGAGEDDPMILADAWRDPDVAQWTTVPEDHSIDAARTWIRGEELRRSRGLAMDLVISKLDEPRIILARTPRPQADPGGGVQQRRPREREDPRFRPALISHRGAPSAARQQAGRASR